MGLADGLPFGAARGEVEEFDTAVGTAVFLGGAGQDGLGAAVAHGLHAHGRYAGMVEDVAQAAGGSSGGQVPVGAVQAGFRQVAVGVASDDQIEIGLVHGRDDHVQSLPGLVAKFDRPLAEHGLIAQAKHDAGLVRADAGHVGQVLGADGLLEQRPQLDDLPVLADALPLLETRVGIGRGQGLPVLVLHAQGLLDGAHEHLEIGHVLVGEGQEQDEKAQQQGHHVGECRHPRRNALLRLGRVGLGTAPLLFQCFLFGHTLYQASLWGMCR